jgi:hypothetical protein
VGLLVVQMAHRFADRSAAVAARFDQRRSGARVLVSAFSHWNFGAPHLLALSNIDTWPVHIERENAIFED